MFITNTSSYPDAEVFRLVRYAFKGINTSGVGILVKAARKGASTHGYTHPRVPRTAPVAWHKDVTRFVMLAIGAADKFPTDNTMYTPTKRRTVPLPPERTRDSMEALLRDGEQLWRIDWRTNKLTIVTMARIPYGGLKSPLIKQADWQEGLVALAAHEARHVWQFQRNDRERAAGIPKRQRSGFGEADAERYAALVLENFQVEREDVLDGPLRAVAHRPTGQSGRQIIYSLFRRIAPHR